MPIIKPNLRPNGPNAAKATKKQIDYIECLLIDMGRYDSRKTFLLSRFGLKFFDELTLVQASELIEELKSEKERLAKDIC